MLTDTSSEETHDVQTTGRRIAVTLLRHALGFRECAPEAVDALVSVGHVRSLGKGEVLVRRGEPFSMLCVVLEGELEVCVMQRDGRRQLAGYLGPGDLAGIMSLWDGLSHPLDMFSRSTPTRVLLVPGSNFAQARDAHPSLARALELQMAYRSRLMHERIAGDAAPLDTRLARLLHLLSMVSGKRESQGQVHLKLSQADIGDFLGVSRQRANFAVQQLRREGLLELHSSQVSIVDTAGLAQRAGL